MSDKTVLITDYAWPTTAVEAAILVTAQAKLLIAEQGDEAELLRLVPQADAILTCFKKVSAAVIRAGTRLQVIGRYGIGVDNIAVDEATGLGIPVTNVPAYCLDEVAEHALALLLACARNIPYYDRAVRTGKWTLNGGRPLYRVHDKTLGIIGFGKIGQRLAQKASSFGLKLLVHTTHPDDIPVQYAPVEFVSLDELLRRSDFVSLHVPLHTATRHMINRDALRLMKPSAFLINTARGGLVDHMALLEALQVGQIAGAGLDVFETEPLDSEHPLFALPTVIATPHAAFYSEESLVELQTRAAASVAAILSGRRPESVVNPQVLDLPRWVHLK